MDIPQVGDLLLFRPDYEDGLQEAATDLLIACGERLQHPGLRIPVFVHVGVVTSFTAFFQQLDIAQFSAFSTIPGERSVWIKKLELTEDQRRRVPDIASRLAGTRYDLELDALLGGQYLYHAFSRWVRTGTCGVVRLPQLHIARETPGRLICSTCVADILRAGGCRVIRNRIYSPEGLALLPGELRPWIRSA